MQPRGGEPIVTALAIVPVMGSAHGRPRFLCALRDITRRKRIERRLKESERQYRSLYREMLAHRDTLRILSDRYLHVREEEAKRIAHQLHDEAGQITASIHLALADIGRDLPAAGRERLQQVTAYLDEIEERLRRLSHELRPTITISGTRSAPKSDDFRLHSSEAPIGPFRRTVFIPGGMRDTEPRAEMKDGVLDIRIHKESSQVTTPRTVRIN